MTQNNTVLIMAGGTGGHIIPALAVAKALQAHGMSIHWLGTPRGLENTLVPPTGIPLHRINMQGIRGKGVVKLLLAPWQLLRAIGQAIRTIRQLKPALVVGFGGFVTAPGGIAAWLLRKSLLLHEQNAVAGMSNRYLAYLANTVCEAFPNTFTTRYRAITCGNPVRDAILALPQPAQRLAQRQGPMQVLIVGGSQGAAIFNQQLPEIIATLPAAERPLIWHSTGKGAQEKVQAVYQQLGVPAKVMEFIEDMPAAYAWADIVICRAGALTVAELAAAGVASILIPFPQAVDDHQTKNASWLVNANAAILLPQASITTEKLYTLLQELSHDRARLLNMANNARKCAMLEATPRMVTECVALMRKEKLTTTHTEVSHVRQDKRK